MNGYALAYRNLTEGKTLLPGVLVWRSSGDLSTALCCSEPKKWSSTDGPRSLWEKQQLAHLHAEAGVNWEDRGDDAIFLFRVKFRKRGQREVSKHVSYAGGREEFLQGWVTQEPVTIYSQCSISHTRTLYGEADPDPSGFRFWPRPFPLDDTPEDSSLVVTGPAEVRGVCVFDLTTVYEDWSRTIPVRHEASRFAWDPEAGGGQWRKFRPDEVYPAHWELVPTIFDKLIEG